MSRFQKPAMTKILIVLVLGVVLVLVQKYELGGYFTLDNLKAQRLRIDQLYRESPVLVIGVYFALYAAAAAINIPPALLMSLASGALFGLALGTLLNALASTFGATVVFLTGRYLIRDTLHFQLQKRFGDKVNMANEGIRKEGATYLLFLRMTPLLPFFMTNILMSLTPVRLKTFVLITLLGMLPGEIAYINAGTKIMEVQSLKGVLSFDLLLSLGIIALLPFLTKFTMKWIRVRKVNKAI